MYIYRYPNYKEKKEMVIMTVRILVFSTGRWVMTRETEAQRGNGLPKVTLDKWQQLMFES